MSLYRHPEVYATLLYPEPDLLDALFGWIGKYLDGDCESVMDPCCGPATWLLPFACRDYEVAGNDLLPEMVAEAERRLAGTDAELTRGDMRELAFTKGPFDVALNLHGSVGHLPDHEAVAEHLAAVRDELRPGGLYFLGLCVFDGDEADETLEVLYESEPTPVASGGMASVRYESVLRDPVTSRETIRVHLLTQGVEGCPAELREQYDLRTFHAEDLRTLVEDAGFQLLAAHGMEEDGFPDRGLYANCGDVTLVLRHTG